MVARYRLAWIAAWVLSVSPAFAEESLDPREVQARKDCLTGKVESGVALLAELYAVTTNANFLYNQARCYEQNARPEDAINHFREYLRVAKDIGAEEKADVDKHIAECRALVAERQRAVAPLPQPSSPAPGLDVTTRPATAASTSEAAPLYRRWWFWAGAAAVVVVGTVTTVLIAHRANDPCDGASLACRTVK
jgi:hypothetical protein